MKRRSVARSMLNFRDTSRKGVPSVNAEEAPFFTYRGTGARPDFLMYFRGMSNKKNTIRIKKYFTHDGVHLTPKLKVHSTAMQPIFMNRL